MEPGFMFIQSTSPYSFDETVERISKAVEKHEWKMPAVHNLQETMQKFGKDVLPVKVFEICHPSHSSRILSTDHERFVSALMPCRIAVYNHSDGKTFVSRINSGQMAAGFGGIIEAVMKDATRDLEMIIEDALK